jgi:nitrogen regulatory protein P-II 1
MPRAIVGASIGRIVMKKIEALVRTGRLDDIVERLLLIGTSGLTLTEAHGISPSTTSVTVIHGQRMWNLAAPRYHLMLVVRDEDAPHVVSAIMRTARTEAPGDGLITVTDVDGVMRIRTGEVDEAAL